MVNFSRKSFLTKRRGNRIPGRPYGFPSPARALSGLQQPWGPCAALGWVCVTRARSLLAAPVVRALGT